MKKENDSEEDNDTYCHVCGQEIKVGEHYYCLTISESVDKTGIIEMNKTEALHTYHQKCSKFRIRIEPIDLENYICPICGKSVDESTPYVTLSLTKEYNNGTSVDIIYYMVIACYHKKCSPFKFDNRFWKKETERNKKK